MQAGRLLPATTLLRSIADKLPPAPRKPAAAQKRRGGACRITDDDVRSMRFAHEQDGVSVGVLAERYGITREYCRAILTYSARCRNVI